MLYAVCFISTPHQCAVLERGWECYNGCKLSAAYQYKTLSSSVVLWCGGCSSLHLSTSPPPRFDTFPPPKKAHLHPPKSTSPPPKKTHFIPPLKFFQRTKTTKLKVKVNVFAAQVHVEDLVVAHIEQNLTMCNAKLE